MGEKAAVPISGRAGYLQDEVQLGSSLRDKMVPHLFHQVQVKGTGPERSIKAKGGSWPQSDSGYMGRCQNWEV